MLRGSIFLFSILLLGGRYAGAQSCEEQLSDSIRTIVTNSTSSDGCIYYNPQYPGDLYSKCTAGSHKISGGASSGSPIIRVEVKVTDTHVYLGSYDPVIHEVGQVYELTACYNPFITASMKANSCPIEKPGSVIYADNQVLMEQVPIVGTQLDMMYVSSYQKGYVKDFHISLSLVDSVPRDFVDIFNIQIYKGATLVDSVTYTSAPNLTYQGSWDGLDEDGVNTVVSQKMTAIISESSTAGNFVVPYDFYLKHFDAKRFGLGGWLPSNFMFFDKNSTTLFFADGRTASIDLKIRSTNTYLYKEDDSRMFEFNSDGFLIAIRHSMSGAAVQQFIYNSNGHLLKIVDPFGGEILFSRNLSGALSEIVGPFGQVTEVSVNANGMISSFENPKAEKYEFTYGSSTDLLISFKKPSGRTSTFLYSGLGLLIKDTDYGGSFTELLSILNDGTDQNNSSVKVITSMGREEIIRNSIVNTTNAGEDYFKRRTFAANGDNRSTQHAKGPSGYSLIEESAAGTKFLDYTLDPQMGTGSFYLSSYSDSTSRSYSIFRSVDLVDSTDPFSISTWTDSIYIGGTSYLGTYTFDPMLKEFGYVSTLGRTSSLKMDIYGRPTDRVIGSLLPVQYTYSGRHLASVSQGTRSVSLSYSSEGYLESVENSLGQVTSYIYDLAGRVSSVVLPDARVLVYTYDSDGNVSGIETPSGKNHLFSYNASSLLGEYAPPALVGVPAIETDYIYNADKQLTHINRPDGSVIEFVYDLVSGLRTGWVTSEGTASITYTSGARPYGVSLPSGIMTTINYHGRTPVGTYVESVANGFIGSYQATIS
nr:hypothetical protein HAGR004_20400 [Bdellovibrio sp. HAGR004]